MSRVKSTSLVFKKVNIGGSTFDLILQKKDEKSFTQALKKKKKK